MSYILILQKMTEFRVIPHSYISQRTIRIAFCQPTAGHPVHHNPISFQGNLYCHMRVCNYDTNYAGRSSLCLYLLQIIIFQPNTRVSRRNHCTQCRLVWITAIDTSIGNIAKIRSSQLSNIKAKMSENSWHTIGRQIWWEQGDHGRAVCKKISASEHPENGCLAK